MNKVANPITVLDLRDSPWVDGPGRTILDCAETVDPQRCRIIVGAFDGGKAESTAYEHEARKRDLMVERIKEKRSLDPNVLKQVITIARKHNADILHTHDFRSDIFGLASRKVLRIPMVVTAHGWIANDLKGQVSTILDKLIMRSAQHVITVSDRTRTLLGKWASDERCTVIPNALRVLDYKLDRRANTFRSQYGIEDHHTVIANIGRLSPEKGQGLFLEAAKVLLSRHRDLKFVLFGIGPTQPELENFVRVNEMSNQVIFAGYRTDMKKLYNEMDLVVQSSSTEGMPNVVLEALLMELPVIATDVGGTREVLNHGVTGTLIPAEDQAALVSAIEAFLKNPDEKKALAIEGRKDIGKRFDHAVRVEKLQHVYEKVLKEVRR